MALIVLVFLIVLFAVPSTWFLMLFLGNLGIHLSFWACLPGALALRTLTVNSKD